MAVEGTKIINIAKILQASEDRELIQAQYQGLYADSNGFTNIIYDAPRKDINEAIRKIKDLIKQVFDSQERRSREVLNAPFIMVEEDYSLIGRTIARILDRPHDYPVAAMALTGGFIAIAFTTAPYWAGILTGTAIYAGARAILCCCKRKRVPVNVVMRGRTLGREEEVKDLTRNADEKDRLRALELSTLSFDETKVIADVGFKRYECPLSLQEIPSGQEIEVNGIYYNIHAFTLGILSLNEKEFANPVNRQRLEENTIIKICNFYKITKEEFLGCFSSELIDQIVEEKMKVEIKKGDHLGFDEQIAYLRTVQDGKADILRDIRKELFLELVRSKVGEESFQFQGLLET